MDFVASLSEKLGFNALFLLPLIPAILYSFKNRLTFKATELEKLFKEVALLKIPIDEKIEILQDRLRAKYPGRIHPNPKWFLNYAGGIFCGIKVLYVSNWEYILVWGTPSGNEGVTGRHPLCRFHDTTLEGEVMWWSEDNPLETERFKQGDQWVHGYGDSGGQRIDGAGWAVEYCHGPLISILPFGLICVLFNTMDYWSYLKTLWIYVSTMVYCNYLPSFLQWGPKKRTKVTPNPQDRFYSGRVLN